MTEIKYNPNGRKDIINTLTGRNVAETKKYIVLKINDELETVIRKSNIIGLRVLD